MSRTYRSNDFPGASARYDAWRTSPPDLYDRDPGDDAMELDDPEHVFWPDDEPSDWDE